MNPMNEAKMQLEVIRDYARDILANYPEDALDALEYIIGLAEAPVED